MRSYWQVLVIICILTPPVPLFADPGVIFIDPSDAGVIRRVQVPFSSQVILTAQELPKTATSHPDIHFGEQSFSYLVPSPDGEKLAISVDGATHDWAGVFSLEDKSIRQLTLCFESKAKAPHWSADGRYLIFEEAEARQKEYLEVFDLAEHGGCKLEGRDARNKFFNFSDPWWGEEGGKLFFKVTYNNVYRKSVGLKPKQFKAKIGESTPDCSKVKLYSVTEFLEKYPQAGQLTHLQKEATPLALEKTNSKDDDL